MMIAYNTQASNPDKHPQMPSNYYFDCYEIDDSRQSEFEGLGYTVKTEAEFNTIMNAIDLSAYNAAIAPTTDQIIDQALLDAQDEGARLLAQFKRENVENGISSTDLTPFVSKFVHNLEHFMDQGSLKEAVNELDRLIAYPSTFVVTITDTRLGATTTKLKSQLSPYITNTRMTDYKHLIQDYLGVPHT